MSVSTATNSASGATPRIKERADALEAEFGTPFELWFGRDQWQRISVDGQFDCIDATSADVDARVAALLSSAQELDAPTVASTSETQCRLAVPVEGGPANAIVATAEFSNTSPDLLLRHAVLFADAAYLREENCQLHEIKKALTHTVTESFEELIFLRELAAHLKLGPNSSGPNETAEKLLPHLCATLRTEGVALISEIAIEEEENTHGDHPCGVTSEVVWTGEHRLDDLSCVQIAQTFSVQARDGAVIQNDFQQHFLAANFPAIREFVLVEVNNGPSRRWLLAVNRRVDKQGQTANAKAGEKEFGTIETTFLSSAASFLATHFHNVDLLGQQEELFLEVVRALVNAVEARDPYTCGHSERVALYARRLGAEVGMSEEMCELLYLSGLLHDVGKIAVKDATLRKPAKLDEEELLELSRHPDLGWAILHDLKHLRDVMPGVLYHHERYDGRGYPDKLVGKEIPVEGRILAICDAYDAMTSDRPYRQGMPLERAESIIRQGGGTQWDPDFVKAFFSALPDINVIRTEYQPRVDGTARRPATSDR